MALKLSQIAEMRDRLHKLNLKASPQWRELYKALQLKFMIGNEKLSRAAYPDHKQNITVGIGFNMDRREAREEWEALFKGRVSFHDVYHQKISLTEKEVSLLFEACMETRLLELKRVYGASWDGLKPNEQMAIEDAYFNGAKLVGGGTHFLKNIKLYAHTSDPLYLEKAVIELRDRSNMEKDPKKWQGVQNRRHAQVEMLDSSKCPSHSKPDDPAFSPSPPLHLKSKFHGSLIPL
jgi:hypothetical protein